MRLLYPFFAFVFAAVSGCTHCCHRAGDVALSANDCGEQTACQRARVYAVLVNGLDPLHLGHIEKLATELNKLGFAKIYTVEFYHAAFVESEVQKIRCADPDARFVLVGYQHGAGVAQSLASRLTHGGVCVDALVELTPAYLPLSAAGQDLSRVGQHVIIGREWQETKYRQTNSQILVVPGAGPYSVATNPVTVQTIRDIMLASTAAVPTPAESFPTRPLLDEQAPQPGETLTGPK